MTFVLAVLKKFLNESFKDISLFSYQCSLFCCCSATFISYHRTKCLSTTFLFFFFAAVQQLLYLTRSKALCQQLFKIIFCCPLRNISASRVSLKIISCCDVFVNNLFIFFLLSFEAVIRFAVNMAQQRVQEAKKLGFETCILPKVCLKNMGKTEGIQLIGVSDVREAIQAILANGKKV